MGDLFGSSSSSAKQRLSSFSPTHSHSILNSNYSFLLSQTQTHLSSFTTSPLKLTEAGFEHLPDNNKYAVMCKQCKLVYHSWEGESPMAVHMTLRPECPFLKADKAKPTPPSILSTPQTDIMTHNVVNHGNAENHIERLSNIRRQLFPSSATDSSDSLDVQAPFIPKDGNRLMLFESHRILTFLEPCSLQAAMYAAAGFKFCANGLAVCVFCELEMELYHYGSSTHLEMLHEEQSPNCPFTKGYDVCNISSDCERTIKSKFYRNMCYPLKHIEFEPEEARIGSFKTWPDILRHEFPPQKMAECGFFYSGGADSVYCFCCGVGLFGWKAEVNPFKQHARASPQCLFLLRVKGQEFVRDAQHEKLDVHCVDHMETQDLAAAPSISSPSSSSPSTPEELPSSPLGHHCLDMETIKKALACGKYYPNDELLQGYLKARNDNYKQVREVREENIKHKTELKAKDTQLQSKDSVIQAKDTVIQVTKAQLQAKDTQLQAKDTQLQAKDTQLQAKDRELVHTRQSLECQDVQERSALVQQIEQQNDVIHQKDEVIEQNREVIEQNREVIERKDEVIEQNREELDLKDKTIELLQSQFNSLMEAMKQKDPTYQWNGPVNPTYDDNFPVARCLICLSKPSRVAFFPCRHLCCCESCAPKLQGESCPVCRGPKKSLEIIFVN